MTAQDWRLTPMAVAGWLGAYLGLSGAVPLVVGCLSTLLAIGLLLWGRRLLATAVVVGVVAAAVAGLRMHVIESMPVMEFAREREQVSIDGRLSTEPRIIDGGPGPGLAILEIEMGQAATNTLTCRCRGPVVILSDPDPWLDTLTPGAYYRFTGRAGPPKPGSREIITVSAHSRPTLMRGPGLLDRIVNVLRTGIREAASSATSEQAALLPSLVVGDSSEITEEMKLDFQATSLSHLLAVSGANLTLMLGVVLGLVRAVGLRGWAVRIAALGCVGLFVVLCRFEPSVVRAAAMGLIALASLGVRRGHGSLCALSLAVIVLMLLDPWLARSIAFALSVSACAGISILAGPWVSLMQRWAPRWFADALCVPLAAQLATQPIITAISGQVSVVGVLTNMLAGPFVGPATVLGMATCLASLIPGLAPPLAWIAGWMVQPILWLAHGGAALPQAQLPWLPTIGGLVAISVLCLGVAVLSSFVLRSAISTSVAIAMLIGAVLIRPASYRWPDSWQAVFCDVGQADMTLLRAGETSAVVIDTGADPVLSASCLTDAAIDDIPVLVLTHFHADHIGGAEEIIKRFQPDLVVVSPYQSPPGAAHAVEKAAQVAGSAVQTASIGQQITVGTVQLNVLYTQSPPPGSDAQFGSQASAIENDSSVILVAQIDQLRILLPGDAGPQAQRRTLRASDPTQWDVDIVKLAHHGSRAQDRQFLEQTGARVAVVSAGRDNDYGHPAPQTVALVRRLGMDVVSTADEGSLAVTFDDGQPAIAASGKR